MVIYHYSDAYFENVLFKSVFLKHLYLFPLSANGKTLVAGTGALVNIWATHRNTDYWGLDAEEFRPERFLVPLSHPAAFLAFSFGVRNCIGEFSRRKLDYLDPDTT